jgi:outer membrane protein assembly factor BamB
MPLSTTPSSVVAYKVVETGTSISLSPGWTLSGLKTPLAPLVVNGVVFALSSGDSAAAAKGTAELYAIDSITGKALWTSGKTITGSVPQSSALWNSMGQILIGTYDNTIYAFGMNLERHL